MLFVLLIGFVCNIFARSTPATGPGLLTVGNVSAPVKANWYFPVSFAAVDVNGVVDTTASYGVNIGVLSPVVIKNE
jgi:hypothetical protein